MVFYVVLHYSKCLCISFYHLNNLWFNGLVKTYFMFRIPSRELSISLKKERVELHMEMEMEMAKTLSVSQMNVNVRVLTWLCLRLLPH